MMSNKEDSVLKTNPSLAVSIPTYNRDGFLEYSLGEHLPILEQYSIPLYVFDNHSSDRTESIVRNFQDKYPLLRYVRQKKNIGPLRNISEAYFTPSEEFVWVIGDTYKITSDAINFILTNLNGIDVFLFNLSNVSSIPSQVFTERDQVLTQLSGIASCLSSPVFNREALHSIDKARYQNSYYPHTGYVFEILSSEHKRLYWVQHHSIYSIKGKNLSKRNWSAGDRALEIGVTNWANFIFSLPETYSFAAKLSATREFGKVSKLLTVEGIIWMRLNNGLNFARFYENRKAIKLCLNSYINYYLMQFLCLIPNVFWRIALKIYNRYNNNF
jgi:glycosyltransferase involved in cell wall biosynthesis